MLFRSRVFFLMNIFVYLASSSASYADWMPPASLNPQTPLHHAAKDRSVDQMKKSLDSVDDLKTLLAENEQGWTVLHFASHEYTYFPSNDEAVVAAKSAKLKLQGFHILKLVLAHAASINFGNSMQQQYFLKTFGSMLAQVTFENTTALEFYTHALQSPVLVATALGLSHSASIALTNGASPMEETDVMVNKSNGKVRRALRLKEKQKTITINALKLALIKNEKEIVRAIVLKLIQTEGFNIQDLPPELAIEISFNGYTLTELTTENIPYFMEDIQTGMVLLGALSVEEHTAGNAYTESINGAPAQDSASASSASASTSASDEEGQDEGDNWDLNETEQSMMHQILTDLSAGTLNTEIGRAHV